MNRLCCKRLLGFAFCCALVAGLTAGCSKAAKQKRYLEKADSDYKAERYDRAEIEYLMALRIPPTPPEALAKLGLIYSLQGHSRAAGFLKTASERGTTNIEARLKLAQMFPASFEAVTNALLELAPTNSEALLLLAYAGGTNNVPELKNLLQSMPAAVQKSAPYHTALGNLSLRQRLLDESESPMHLENAEREFQQAIAIDPKFTSAYMGLAHCYFARTNLAQFEAALKQAIATDPKSTAAYAQLAAFYRSQTNYAEAEATLKQAVLADPNSINAHAALYDFYHKQTNHTEAEAELKRAAELAPVRSPVRLGYANYLREHHSDNPARTYVEEQITKKAPDYLPAWQFLAELALEGGDTNACAANLQKVLAKDPDGYSGLLLGGKLMLAQGQITNAINHFERMADAYPKAPEVHYQLAYCYRFNRELQKAQSAVDKAVRLNPHNIDPVLLQAELNLGRQNAAAAVRPLRNLLELADPQRLDSKWVAHASYLLTCAYAAQGDLNQAMTSYRWMTQVVTNGTKELQNELLGTHLVMGYALKGKGRRAEARQAFASALKIQTNAVQPFFELVDLDLKEQAFTNAFARINERLEYDSTNGWFMLGVAHYAQAAAISAQVTNTARSGPRLQMSRPDVSNHVAEAAQAFKKALPLFPGAYLQLAQLYVDSGQQQQALDQLNIQVEGRTNDVVALGRIGEIQSASKKYVEAADAYEKCIKRFEDGARTTPRRVSRSDVDSYLGSLNNLAFLYSERLDKLDDAYKVGQKLQGTITNVAAFGDTWGWILYRKGQYTNALSHLKRVEAQYSSAGRVLDPEVMFHLGMAYYMTGDEQAARAALKRFIDTPAPATQESEDAEPRSQAEQRLRVLEIDPAKADAAALPLLESFIKETPGDPVALLRLGAIQERDGAFEKALQSYQKALESNTENPGLLNRMALLYAVPLKQLSKGFDLAKQARTLDQNDPRIEHTLGRLTFLSGDYTRAFTLLQEAAPGLPNDPEVAVDLALSHFSLGRIPEAAEALRPALGGTVGFARTEEAKLLASMVEYYMELSKGGGDPERSIASARLALTNSPNYVPAIAVCAAGEERRSKFSEAARTYEIVLANYPQFTPGLRSLTRLYYYHLKDENKAYDTGVQARQAFREDAEIAKILGILEFKRNNFDRATQFLKEASRVLDKDEEIQEYLLKLKQR